MWPLTAAQLATQMSPGKHIDKTFSLAFHDPILTQQVYGREEADKRFARYSQV